MRAAAFLLLLATACGTPFDGAGLTTTVHMDALLADQVSTLDIFVLSPERSDGVILTRDDLLSGAVLPTDQRVEIYGQKALNFLATPKRDTQLDGIPEGTGRIVFIAAYDSGGVLLARGCTDDITVEKDKTTAVEVRVLAL